MANELIKIFNTISGLKAKQLQPIIGDVSSRCYFRVELETNESHILTQVPLNEKEQVIRFIEYSLFYNKKLIPSPTVLNNDYLLNNHFIYYIQTDLGSNSLESYYKSSGNLDMHKASLDLMYKVNNTDSPYPPSTLPPFDKNLFTRELELFHNEFVLKILNLERTDTADNFLSIYKIIIDELLISNFELTHRDFHSRNIIIDTNKPFIIDYQDTRLAPIYYDFSSLVFDPYCCTTHKEKEDLINYYSNNHKQIRFEDFHTVSIQRLIKAIGTFSMVNNLKNDNSYLKNISPALQNILFILENFDKYSLKPYIKCLVEKWSASYE